MTPARLWPGIPADLGRTALVLMSLITAGCASRPSVVEIRVPVPIECRVDRPQRPAMPTDSLKRSDPLDRKVKALLAEIETREGYEIQLVAALELCRQPLPAIAPTP